MTRNLTKVIYKPDSMSTVEYMVIVDPEEFKKWKEGDTSVALTSVVDSFEIFQSNQGSQGYLGRPSKQDLENTFGTHKDDDVIRQILQRGTEQTAKMATGGPSLNYSRGSADATKEFRR